MTATIITLADHRTPRAPANSAPKAGLVVPFVSREVAEGQAAKAAAESTRAALEPLRRQAVTTAAALRGAQERGASSAEIEALEILAFRARVAAARGVARSVGANMTAGAA